MHFLAFSLKIQKTRFLRYVYHQIKVFSMKDQKSGHMILKGFKWLHNDKIWSYGHERNNLGAQYKNQVIWSRKESIGYNMQNKTNI